MSSYVYSSYYSSYLSHHGIKGQRWGVRRTPAQLGYGPSRIQRFKNSVVSGGGKVISAGKHAGSSAYNTVKTARQKRVEADKRKISARKPLYELSDQELKERIDRMDLELKYKQKLKDTGRVKGEGTVHKIFSKAAEDLGSATVKYFGGRIINNLFGADIVQVGKSHKEKEAEAKKKAEEQKHKEEREDRLNREKREHEIAMKNAVTPDEAKKQAAAAAGKAAQATANALHAYYRQQMAKQQSQQKPSQPLGLPGPTKSSKKRKKGS